MKKALFYNPYLDSLGGGERYVLTLVEALNQRDWQTTLLWSGGSVTGPVKQKFNLDISATTSLPSPQNLLARWQLMRNYDFIFWISDGSLPFLFGKHNIVHLQVPFHDIGGKSLFNQIKKLTIHNFVVNSQFTKQIVDREYGITSQVIYPPVDVTVFKPLLKLPAILYAARFSNLLQQKGHSLAIETFKQLCDEGTDNYELWLTGGTAVGADELLGELKDQAKGYPIKFFPDVDFASLKTLYGQAQMFWSAVGYEIDEIKEPEKCEHFGIALVEAMAAGCAPMVIRKGGYKEIVEDQVSGIFWDTPQELITWTQKLIQSPVELKRLQETAIKQAQNFSRSRFVSDWLQLVDK